MPTFLRNNRFRVFIDPRKPLSFANWLADIGFDNASLITDVQIYWDTKPETVSRYSTYYDEHTESWSEERYRWTMITEEKETDMRKLVELRCQEDVADLALTLKWSGLRRSAISWTSHTPNCLIEEWLCFDGDILNDDDEHKVREIEGWCAIGSWKLGQALRDQGFNFFYEHARPLWQKEWADARPWCDFSTNMPKWLREVRSVGEAPDSTRSCEEV